MKTWIGHSVGQTRPASSEGGCTKTFASWNDLALIICNLAPLWTLAHRSGDSRGWHFFSLWVAANWISQFGSCQSFASNLNTYKVMTYISHVVSFILIIFVCFTNLNGNVYKKYKKFINSKLPSRPEPSLNLKLCFIKIAQVWLIYNYFGWILLKYHNVSAPLLYELNNNLK